MRTIVNKVIVGTIASDVTSPDYYILDFKHVDSEELKKWVLQEQSDRTSRTTFDWRIIANQYAKLYQKILKIK